MHDFFLSFRQGFGICLAAFLFLAKAAGRLLLHFRFQLLYHGNKERIFQFAVFAQVVLARHDVEEQHIHQFVRAGGLRAVVFNDDVFEFLQFLVYADVALGETAN